MNDPIGNFQKKYMSYGDRLSEWFYGFVMVAIITGMISGFVTQGLDRQEATIALLIIAFSVNTTWGLIDGGTVIYGGLTDKADQERRIGELKKDRNNRQKRDDLLESLDSSAAIYLGAEEKERIIDSIIEVGPEARKTYHFSKEDRNTMIATASCDILAVIPVILPFLLLGFNPMALMLSRLIAAVGIGYIVFSYAKHTGRRKWAIATIFIVMTIAVMSITYYLGW
jgi:VIT1/CCC1 family predicted Fe2+/Mn2+ transporter